MNDEMARLIGFADAKDLHRMVASVDLTIPGNLERLKSWQSVDGTKEGLEQLLSIGRDAKEIP